MHQVADQWIELNKAHLDYTVRLAGIAFEGWQRVVRAHLDMAASALAAVSGEVAPLAEARDINGVLTVSARIAQPVLNKHAAYAGEVCGAIAQSHVRAHELARQHVDSVGRRMAAALG